MADLTVTKTYDDNTTLTEAQLDSIKSSIETYINSTKLTSANLLDGGITTALFQNNTVATADINDAAITTAKILDGSVTLAKLEAVGQQTSSSTGATVTITGTTYTDVTNLTLSLTTVGRPVVICLVGDIAGDSEVYCTRSDASLTLDGYIKVLRSGTDVAIFKCHRAYSNSVSTIVNGIFWGGVITLDTPAAGTYTYKIQAKGGTANTSIIFKYLKLLAYEL